MQKIYPMKTGLYIGLIALIGGVLAIMLVTKPAQSAPLGLTQPSAMLPFGAAAKGTPEPAPHHPAPNGSDENTYANQASTFQSKRISKLYLPSIVKVSSGGQPPTDTPTLTPTATATTPAPGDTATDFINNTSYTIVSLQVDGVELFPTSPMGILPGGSYRMDLTAGQHTFFAQNGYWEVDGTRAPFYQWQGTFEQQANLVGSVTFTDPTIEQLLTEFGTSTYWEGEYWTGTPVELHYAGFCFYSNSAFIFYIDGNQNDTGTYSLLNRQPSIFTVNFRVTNTAGTEYFDGALSEINGDFIMANGPPDWPQIDYYPSSSVTCP